MDTERIQSLLTEAQSSLSVFQKTQGETSRADALEKVTKLARALEKPKDALLKLSYTVSICHLLSKIGPMH